MCAAQAARVVMVKCALLFLLLFLVPFALAEDYCSPDGQGNVLCTTRAAYTAPSPTFEVYCSSIGGTYIGNPATVPTICEEVCCCKQGANEALDGSPITKARCQGFGQYRINPVQPDCAAACGASGGGTPPSTFTVSGHVYDIKTAGSPVGLDSAVIEFPVGSQLKRFYSHTGGAFTLTGVPGGAVSLTFRASKQGCGQQQISQVVSAAITNLDFQLDCSSGGCAPEPVNDTTATPVKGTPQVKVSWTEKTCSDAEGALIYRCAGDKVSVCDKTTAEVVGYVPRGGHTFVDTVAPGQGYCYIIKGLKPNGDKVDQALPENYVAHCVYAMNEFCTSDPPVGARCFNDLEVLPPIDREHPLVDLLTPNIPGPGVCGLDNRLTITKCSDPTKLCVEAGGTAACRSVSDCVRCNGLFGFFVDLAAHVTSGSTCEKMAACYLDNNEFAVDTFTSCAYVTSCFDYHSAAACGGDHCGADPNHCKWINVTGLEELGKGVCVPKSGITDAPCESCSEIFGSCNAALCDAMDGDANLCYYNDFLDQTVDEADLVGDGCISKKDMACRFYDNQTDCVGSATSPKPVLVNATYSSAGSRNGTNNEVVRNSADRFGLGRCAWVTTADDVSFCVKNANNRTPELAWRDMMPDDDCFETEDADVGELGACLRDVMPPTTTLPFTPGMFIDAARLKKTTPIVTDDTYPASAITSWFCLVLKGGTCYPNINHIQNLIPGELGRSGYTLFYYSEDPAGNLEPVRSIDLIVYQDSDAHLVEARLVESGT